MNLSTKMAKECEKQYFFKLYSDAMKGQIEILWGWDQKWQINDSEERWNSCANYVIYNAGQRIGYFQIMEEKDEAYIMMFIIDEEYRSQGIGCDALALLNRLISNNVISLRVFKTNLKALAFYERNGFSISKQENEFYLMHKKVT